MRIPFAIICQYKHQLITAREWANRDIAENLGLFEDNLKKLNIVLPKPADPVGSYVATKIVGKLLYISGQISMNDKGELIKGKVILKSKT